MVVYYPCWRTWQDARTHFFFYNIVNPFWKLHVNYNCKLHSLAQCVIVMGSGAPFLFLLESVAK